MIIRFAVSNFRSFRDQQEVSFVASSLKGAVDGLIASRHAPGGWLLPALLLYGANASGKTNLVKALGWMRGFVLHSHSRSEPGEPIKVDPFVLDADFRQQPTGFELDFVSDGVRYHYGFEVTAEVVLTERLYAYPREKRQMLFERTAQGFEFGRSLKGRTQTISELTRANSLFLSAAAQNGHDELTKLRRFFQSIRLGPYPEHEVADHLKEQPADPRILKVFKAAGTGVVAVSVEAQEDAGSAGDIYKAVMATFRKRTGDDALAEPTAPTPLLISMAHEGSDGRLISLHSHEESEGTRWLLRVLLPAFHCLDQGCPFAIDELDASLHTYACSLIVNLFLSPVTNTKGAQLIATTQDTNLLGMEGLRRDQVWFTEKDRAGATHLYPLTDFHTRETDNIERGYLQGRFGAVPFSGSLSEILSPA